MIQVTNLRKQFGDNEILKGISFDVPDKSILGIIGASGSGKTTLLRCLNGFEMINGGTITCGNIKLEAGISATDYKRRVRDLRLKVGTVFQHFYLFPHLSVVGNIIEAPVHVLRTAKKSAEKRRMSCWNQSDYNTRLDVIRILSGGEQQRWRLHVHCNASRSYA